MKKMKKVLGERDFSILEITNTIKDFETSSMNIFKKTTENDGSDLLLIDPYRKTTTRKCTQIPYMQKSVDSLKNIIAERITH